MHDLSNRTGPYLHAPDDLLRLGYETGGTPRLFTILIASATEKDRIDPEGAGIVILDEDEGRVLLDRHVGEQGRRPGDELYRIGSMGWAEFSGFCRSHPRFRGGPADILTPHDTPLPGSRRRQDRLGPGALSITSPKSADLRSALMMLADQDPTCRVRFPERDRDGVIRDLTDHIQRTADPLPYRLGWSLAAPTAPDLSGLGGDRPVDRSLDLLWDEMTQNRPELVDEAWCGVMETLAFGNLNTIGAQDEGRYDLRLLEARDGASLTLYAFDGQVLGAGSRSDLSDLLDTLSSRDLRDLWKLSRTLDFETGPERVSALFQEGLNRVRAESEASRDTDPAPSGP